MDKDARNLCRSLKCLNIIDFEERCHRLLYSVKPSKHKTIWFLKSLVSCYKLRNDRNGVDCDILSIVTHFFKDLPLNWLLDTNSVKNLKYAFCVNKILCFFKDTDIFNEYAEFIWRSIGLSSNAVNVEVLLLKYLKVRKLLRVKSELSVFDVHHYELVAELLKISHEANVQNSRLIVDLLKTSIEMHVNGNITGRRILQPNYPEGFLNYVLEHSRREQFDLQNYCMEHPRTLWEFSRKLSVVQSVSMGNFNRTICLLQHGIDVFPANEVNKASNKFPFIALGMSRNYLLVLHTMSHIKAVNDVIQRLNRGPGIDPRSQAACFRLMWNSIPDPFLKPKELDLAINTEYFSFALHDMEDQVPYKENMALCDLYETFHEHIAADSEGKPRSLKQLCRCAIRRSLGNCFQLPEGITQLELIPKSLKSYLNLEKD
ncbi:hypothetical protein JTE90_007897 [Oedothorax gibbosus]|uniref:SOCS box domain-containing protein n=1 Tax=Oedothorax gibbosus TaxID=931172 RepID=A0AAV6VHC3_9ARAC|nr:hypothetical protein JTE90_007897 [Oedothorax gibbosus]